MYNEYLTNCCAPEGRLATALSETDSDDMCTDPLALSGYMYIVARHDQKRTPREKEDVRPVCVSRQEQCHEGPVTRRGVCFYLQPLFEMSIATPLVHYLKGAFGRPRCEPPKAACTGRD